MKQETPKQHVELINDNIDEFDEKIKEFKQIDQTNPVTRGSTALVKQETLEEETKCYCGHTTYCDCGPEQDFKDIELPQQGRPETLEEAALIRYGSDQFLWAKQRDGFVEGARWQQERSYSEEDMRKAFIAGFTPKLTTTLNDSFNKWFEQFNKNT